MGYFAYYMMRFKYRVIIESRRATGNKTVVDRGAMVRTKDGVWYLKLLKHKANIRPVDNSFIEADNTIRLRHLGEDLYFPFKIVFDDDKEEALVKKIDYDETLTWFFSFKKLVHDKYDYVDLLAKYAPMISIGIVMMVFLLGMWFLSQNFALYIDTVKQLMSSNAQQIAGI